LFIQELSFAFYNRQIFICFFFIPQPFLYIKKNDKKQYNNYYIVTKKTVSFHMEKSIAETDSLVLKSIVYKALIKSFIYN